MSGFGLDELTAAVHDAVIKASEIGENAALANIQQEEHWEVLKGEDGKPLEDAHGHPIYTPRMVTLRLPTWVDGKQVTQDFEVPLSTLTTNRQLQLDEISIKLQVQLHGLDDLADVGREHRKIRINTNTGGFLARKSGSMAELELKFSGTDASEGSVRIDNQLIKLIP
tara:strand:+ start:51 stop:554 length:504 start_codon:yes stop_codon:yes gene_type:complete